MREKNWGTSATVRLIRCPLNTGFTVVVNNSSNKIYGLLPKKCNGPTYNLRKQKIIDLHKTDKTKTTRFADTFVNKSSYMARYS